MSASSHDALPQMLGRLLKLDAPALRTRDPTEDLADEVTSELDAAPRRAPGPPAALQPAAAPSPPPARDNVLRERYVLETQLGNGGFAMVFRAVDLRRDAGAAEGRRVAIKLLRPELRERAQSIARLQREFRQTQAAAHPSVVRMFDLDCDRGAWFIVMELLTGETLGPALRRAAPAGLPVAEAMRIALCVGDALANAHARGITHGDVKPDNIFLTTAGDVRLLDFGVAPDAGARVPTDEPVAAAATRAYASPEVLAGAAPAPGDDVFSLACLTYEMLAGRHPYGRRGADAAQAEGAVPEAPAALDVGRRGALLSALSFARADRPTMAEFLAAQRKAPAEALPAPIAPPSPVIAPREPVAKPAAVAAAPALAAPGPMRLRLALASAMAAVLALMLGVLLGRIGTDGNQRAVSVTPQPAALEPIELPPPPVEQDAQASTLPVAEDEPAAAPGAPAAPQGLVFFDTPQMIVSKRAVLAAIPLRYLSRERRAVSVRWRAIDGSARAGRDFDGASSGTESFVEGTSLRILYIPIVPTAAATRDRTFAVELTGISEGADLGPTTRVEVTILGDA